MTASPLTSYARLSPWQARAVLAGFVALTVFCLLKAPEKPPIVKLKEESTPRGDVALYRAEVDRMRAGEGYYQAAAEELVQRGYPTKSVFNWRSPLPVWLIARLPAIVLGKVLLGLLALLLVILGFEAAAREQPNIWRGPLPLVVLLCGALLPCLMGDVFVMSELWSGVLLALSVTAYGINRPRWAAVAGVAALVFRELALPYCLLQAAIAARQRRRGELAVWLLGIAAWAVFFALHCSEASRWIGPDAESHRHGWICFGGVSFVMATVQMNSALLLLPQWVTALYFVAAMCGLAGWNTPWGLRAALTGCLYAVAFSIVGQEFNRYWGLMLAPLMCFGAVRCPVSVSELWDAARGGAGRRI